MSLVAPLWCRLIMPAGCRIASCHPLIAPPSRHLVAPAGCCIVSHHPLVVPPSHPLAAPACCCINSPRPLVAPHFFLSSRRLVVASPLDAPPFRPLVVSSKRGSPLIISVPKILTDTFPWRSHLGCHLGDLGDNVHSANLNLSSEHSK